jgi:hypothetical protein
MVITINEDKTASIDGPIGDMVVAYGILEVGKDLVREYHRKPAAGDGETRIVAATPAAAAMLELARQRGGG